MVSQPAVETQQEQTSAPKWHVVHVIATVLEGHWKAAGYMCMMKPPYMSVRWELKMNLMQLRNHLACRGTGACPVYLACGMQCFPH